MIKAVLSTTVLPLDGVYEVTTLRAGEIPDISGVPHYIGHPATKAIVEKLGAVPAETKLFEGLQQGERAICFPIAQGKSSRSETGKTVDQDVDLSDLSVRVIRRRGGTVYTVIHNPTGWGKCDDTVRTFYFWEDVQAEYEDYVTSTCCETLKDLRNYECARDCFFDVHGGSGDEPDLIFPSPLK